MKTESRNPVAPGAWNRPWNIRKSEHARSKPEGGFVFIPAMALIAIWRAYKRGIIGLADLRVWFGCHELLARRCIVRGNRRPRFVEHELVDLIGVHEKQVRASLRKLERTGFLRWSETAVYLDDGRSRLDSVELVDLDRVADALVNRRRKVPVPRRSVRMLCRVTRPVLMATVLGHLLRCMYYRSGQCCPDGRCKSSWIADVFGVDYRNVKAARRELVGMGWLIKEPSDQRSMNRWGRLVRVNLEWDPSSRTAPPESPLLGPEISSRLPPPKDNRELLIGSGYQKPAKRGPVGVCVRRSTQDASRFRRVLPEDLRQPARVAELFEDAVRLGHVQNTPCDRLRVFAAVEHAKTFGTKNPCGLFVWLVRQARWNHLTQRDEDRARDAIRCLMDAPRHSGTRAAGVRRVANGSASGAARGAAPEAARQILAGTALKAYPVLAAVSGALALRA